MTTRPRKTRRGKRRWSPCRYPRQVRFCWSPRRMRLLSSSSSAATAVTSASTPDLARTIASLQRAAVDAYERGERGHFGNPALAREGEKIRGSTHKTRTGLYVR
jgi:hypothetical protein